MSSALLLALGTLGPGLARAQTEPSWDPGNRTTSDVDGQVDSRTLGSRSDGVYGRFDGDLDIGFGAGVEVTEDPPRGALRLSLHYFSMIGIYAGYADAFGASDASVVRLASVGVDVRPAFVPRWSKDMQQGPGVLDLTVDSISLGVGVFWATPRDGSFGDARGLEASLGFGIPLFGLARGPWLEARGLLRWSDPGRTPGERADGALLALLSWHEFAMTEAGD